MSGADKAAAIREKAERLAGRSLGENGDALTEMAMVRACAWCGREDIPEAMEQAVAEVKLRSRQYAKRQLTWLRRNPDIHWILWGEEPNFPQGLQNATEYLTALGLR